MRGQLAASIVHAYRRGLELPPDDALAYVLRQPLDEVT
jgi:hypothetical protein